MRFVVLSFMVVAMPALAQETAPDCYVEVAGDQKMGFYAQDIGGGFVSYYMSSLPPGRLSVVLEHCPSTERMTAQWDDTAQEQSSAIRRQFEGMVEGDAQYTLPQIADALQTLGADAAVRRTGVKSCACKLLATGRLGQGAYQPDVLP